MKLIASYTRYLGIFAIHYSASDANLNGSHTSGHR